MINGDIFWEEDDGSLRKVTQSDIADLDWDKRIRVWVNGEYHTFGKGMALMFAADAS